MLLELTCLLIVSMAVQMIMLEYVTSKALTRETCEIVKVRLLFFQFFVACYLYFTLYSNSLLPISVCNHIRSHFTRVHSPSCCICKCHFLLCI